jgi:hypothetical protein
MSLHNNCYCPKRIYLSEPNQICTNDFINPSWAQAIYDAYSATDTTVYNRDFRFRSFYYFQMLASLCTLANSSLTDELVDFDNTFLISANILPERVYLIHNLMLLLIYSLPQ